MARGAGAVAATGVVEEKIVVECDVEKRLRLAVVGIRQLPVLKFKCLVRRGKRHAHGVWAGGFGDCRPPSTAVALVVFRHGCLSSSVFVLEFRRSDRMWRAWSGA